MLLTLRRLGPKSDIVKTARIIHCAQRTCTHCVSFPTLADDLLERFLVKVKQKWDRHLNEHEGKFTVDQVGTYSVSSQHEQNPRDNQRK